MKSEFIIRPNADDASVRALVPSQGGPIEVDHTKVHVDLAPSDGTPVRSILLGGRSLRVIPVRDATGRWSVQLEHARWEAGAYDRGQDAVLRAQKAAGGASGPPELRAPMPGLVVRIDVEAGMEVQAGQGIVIVEAMKMENELRAPGPARVHKVHVRPGVAVEKDALLVSFEPLEEGD